MAFDFNSCRLVGPDENRLGSGLVIPPAGVSLIVSNGLGVERCHELALAIIRESLLKEGLKEAVIFSRRGKMEGRYMTFAQGVEGQPQFLEKVEWQKLSTSDWVRLMTGYAEIVEKFENFTTVEGQTNAICEGINAMVQAAKRKARGYHTFEGYSAMIYLVAGKLDLATPSPFRHFH